jgi:chromosome segregation ATPase
MLRLTIDELTERVADNLTKQLTERCLKAESTVEQLKAATKVNDNVYYRRNKQVEEKYTKLEMKYSNMRTKLSNQRKDIANKEKRIKDLLNTEDCLRKKVNSLKETAQYLQNEIYNYKEDISNKNYSINYYKQQINKEKIEKDDWKHTTNELRKEIEKCKQTSWKAIAKSNKKIADRHYRELEDSKALYKLLTRLTDRGIPFQVSMAKEKDLPYALNIRIDTEDGISYGRIIHKICLEHINKEIAIMLQELKEFEKK